MEIQRAKELLYILADGINPLTGEVLPGSDSCNQADIVRALHAVLMALDKQPQKKQQNQPENAGKTWSSDEDAQMLYEYRHGTKTSELAKIHKRTKGSIVARLVKLGEINERNEAK